MSIEIYRKGFRLDIKPSQVVTFKKSQNLNGIQDRYAYSNTIQLEDTANNRKLLELFYLPANKISSLMNGYDVDIVLNGSINLRNQTLKIQKESKDKIEAYLLYSDNALAIKLKESYINDIAKSYTYKKTVSDFISKSAFVETQPKSGLYVIEEMPILINVQELLKKTFTDNHYTVYGDFFKADSQFSKYFITPNKGVYQVYQNDGVGFAPSFDEEITAYTFLNNVLSFFNCYAEVDDTYKTVVVNRWTNLQAFKDSFIDYSKYYVDYKDYAFQSKLAKKNELKYSDSGTAYDSFFVNNLSSEKTATYLNAEFGTGSLNIFDDSKIETTGNILTRVHGEVGETSSIRIFKKSTETLTANVYVGGVATSVTNIKAVPQSMLNVYNEFHKDYTDFILTPLLGNFTFRYDEIMATDFSLTKVFFIEQLASYWIPLEVNFSTKKDEFTVKAMLIKKRKVESPILNNFNFIQLDYKQKITFSLRSLLSMYKMPPNKYEWDLLILKSYDQDKNKIFINDVLITSASLPQVFAIADIVSFKVEANKDSDVFADKNSDSLYLQAVDTNGGVSNVAYINIVHTGIASLESNFKQNEEYYFNDTGIDGGVLAVSPNIYYQGLRPNINNTFALENIAYGNPDDDFNLIQTIESYQTVKVEVNPFTLRMYSDNNGLGKAKATCKLIVNVNGVESTLREYSVSGNSDKTFNVPWSVHRTSNSFPVGSKIKVYLQFKFDNTKFLNQGSMDISIWVNNWDVTISTIKTI